MPDSDAKLLSRRITAAWIDIGVLFVLGIVFAILFGHSHAGTTTTNADGTSTTTGGASVSLHGTPFLVYVVLTFVYYLALELLWGGQTIGKRIQRLRVVTVDGSSAGPGPVLLRTLGRIIDALPLFYLVGWLLVRGEHRPRQRLGDRWANTTVISVPLTATSGS